MSNTPSPWQPRGGCMAPTWLLTSSRWRILRRRFGSCASASMTRSKLSSFHRSEGSCLRSTQVVQICSDNISGVPILLLASDAIDASRRTTCTPICPYCLRTVTHGRAYFAMVPHDTPDWLLLEALWSKADNYAV